MEQIFFNQELSDICFEVDALEEWKKLCEELDLPKQSGLAKGKESPVPYPFLNEIMLNTYKTICPTHVYYKVYDKTPIPLKILQQIAFSVKEKHFNRIEIWYNDKKADPLVVGLTGKYSVRNRSYNYVKEGNKILYFNTRELAENYRKEHNHESVQYEEKEKYLIARWGDELKTFEELKKQAHRILIENIGGQLSREIKEKQEKLNLIEENVTAYLNGDISEWSLK
jgi:hypothetical protein